jgi:hypothetical protein
MKTRTWAVACLLLGTAFAVHAADPTRVALLIGNDLTITHIFPRRCQHAAHDCQRRFLPRTYELQSC